MALSQYQARDYEVADYHLYEIPGVPVQIRGPKIDLQRGSYVACLGAAQTFGPLCDKPWPGLLHADGHPTLNLGFGGAGPSFFLLHPKLIELANHAALAIVQVMAARSTRNSCLEIDRGRSNARPRGSNEKFVASEIAYERLCEMVGPRLIQLLVEETRRNWILEMELLLEAIRVPTILFWFAERPPHYAEGLGSVRQMMGGFPQLVNARMLDQIRPAAAVYVECVTSRGMPHALKNRITGEPAWVALGNNKQLRNENRYYPSPQMHEAAAEVLAPLVARFMNTARSRPSGAGVVL